MKRWIFSDTFLYQLSRGMPKAKEKILDESVNLSENIPKTAKTMAQGYTKFIFTRDVKRYSVPYLKFQNTHK